MRRMWKGSATIVLGVTLFVATVLAVFIAKLMPAAYLVAVPAAYLVAVGLVAGGLIGLGYGLARDEMRRQRNMHPY